MRVKFNEFRSWFPQIFTQIFERNIASFETKVQRKYIKNYVVKNTNNSKQMEEYTEITPASRVVLNIKLMFPLKFIIKIILLLVN